MVVIIDIPLLFGILKLPSANPARTESLVTFPMDSLCLACARSRSPSYQKLSTRKDDLIASGKAFRAVRICGLICMMLIITEAFVYLFTWSPPQQVISGAWFVILASCCIHTMLPFALTVSVPVVLIFDATYVTVCCIFVKAASGDMFFQVVAVVLLLIASNMIGIAQRAQTNKRQRDEFLTSLSCLKSTREVQGYISLQEQLLNSVVPSHIADVLKQTIDHNGALLPNEIDGHFHAGGNFRSVMLTRHDSVTVLFADIKGFTKLSSDIPSSQLVQVLNNLFSHLDHLTEASNCYRIKTLGDCYICVCGLLQARNDHADNCVKLGLQMVMETQRLAHETGLDISMRIGIHTGRVIAGVLGRVKWHYDIYSEDVCIAATMEATGVPGAVHISSATHQKLKGSYRLQTRSPVETGLSTETYLVQCAPSSPVDSGVDVAPGKLKSRLSVPKGWDVGTPFSDGVISQAPVQPEAPLGTSTTSTGFHGETIVANNTAMCVPVFTNEEIDEHLETEQTAVMSVNGMPVMAVCDTMTEVLASQQMGKVRAANMNRFTLRFLPAGLERMYLTQEDKELPMRLIVASFVIALVCVSEALVNPHIPAAFWIILAYFVPVALYIFLFVLKHYEISLFRHHHRSVLFIQQNTVARYIALTATCLTLPTLIAFSVAFCEPSIELYSSNSTSHSSSGCDFPEFSFLGLLIAIKLSLIFSSLATYYVWGLNFIIVSVFLSLIYCSFSAVFDRKHVYLQQFYPADQAFTDYISIGLISVILAFVSNVLHGRMGEEIHRFYYLCSWRIANKRYATETLQLHNKHLLLNIMPKHVADYFLDAPPGNMGLYSKSHSHAAVMFATIPNFRCFQTNVQSNESSATECVRLLNEIWCEFDQLLTSNLPDGMLRYPGVEKIKTISSSYTYMVAAGLSEESCDSDLGEDSVDYDALADVKPCPVAELVELAAAFQAKLKELNESCFYDFQLRVGIHEGPLVSGVIGAKKPLFDIFGDTVNVASRMDSTGEVGKIHVLEETARKLHISRGYQYTPRGEIHVKGKGPMKTAFIAGKV